MKDLPDLLDLLDLLVRGDQPVLLDLLDLLADQALRGLQDPLERKEFLVRKDLLALQVVMVSRVPWVFLDLPDHQEYPERMETRVRLENQARRAPREGKESTVLLVHPGQWVQSVSLVLLVLMESLDLGANRGHLELKVTKDPEDSQEPQDPSDCRDCQDHQARRERLEMLDLWVLQALLDPVALPDPTVLTVLKVLLVVWVILDLLERRESPVSLDHLESEESQERRVLVENVERRERQDNLELLDLLEEEDDLEMTDLKETLVPLVSLVILVPLVRLDPEVKTAPREREEKMVNKENLALLDLLVRTDHLAHQERGALLEQEDQRDVRVKKEPRETQVLLAPLERPAPSAPRVYQENQERKVSEDSQDQWESKDLQAPPDRKDHLDLWDLLVCSVCVETPVPRERRDTQVLSVSLDPQESRERREIEVCLALMDPPDLKERLEWLEARDPSALLVLLVCLVLKVSKELRVLPEELVRREKRVYKDLLDLLARQVRSSSPCPSRGVPSPSVPSMPASCSPSPIPTCLHLTPLALSS